MPMITMRRALREHNGVTAVTMAAISSTLVPLLGHVVTAMLSLEAKLMAVSLVWGALYQLQSILVAKRRCSGHWLVQYGAMAAYYLPAPLAFYAASASCYTSHIDEYRPILLLAVLLMLSLSVQLEDTLLFTNMRAYSLRDRPRNRFNYLMWLVILGYVEWEWAHQFSSNSNWAERMQITALVGQICGHFTVLWAILFHNNTWESILDCQTKAVANYMKRESSNSSPTSPFFDDDDDDANSNSSPQLDCCRYPFVLGKDGEWVTVKDLVQRDDLPNEDRDIWLSYSLCRLLARRYYGFHCAEEGDDRVRRFALADLGRTNNGYKRAFTIVEVQLAFLHDYFFTASHPIIESGFDYIDYFDFAQGMTTGIIIWIFFFGFICCILKHDAMIEKKRHLRAIGLLGWSAMAVLLSLLCAVFGFPMLLVQRLFAIYWRPIHTAVHKLIYVPNDPVALMRLVRLFRHHHVSNLFQTGGAYWRNKIGQYSVLQDYDRRRSPRKAFVAWFQQTMLSEHSYQFIKHLPIEEEEVDMLELDSMRQLVANTLRDIDGPPTNGTRSLKINKDEINRARKNRDIADYDLLWTCKQETHTDTILIWHIATCYCDLTPVSDDLLVKWHHEAARALSRYCAYLVAFLPEFLPEHSLTTKQVFQRVMQEAQQELGTKPMKEEEKVTKIRGLQLPDQHEQRTTFHKGVHLGRQLEMLKDDMLCWKVIAEFWAETMLYVAPSDNAEAHIEHLAKGGEFITHLWAMLSNAGILKRAAGEWHPSTSTTKKAPPKKTETTKARTQECPF